jgi:hypothetical protein
MDGVGVEVCRDIDGLKSDASDATDTATEGYRPRPPEVVSSPSAASPLALLFQFAAMMGPLLMFQPFFKLYVMKYWSVI